MRVSFIGFGEAGRAFADSLKAAGAETGAVYDIAFDAHGADAAPARAARERAIAASQSAGEAVAGAEWVICAVTAASSYEAAEAAAPHLTAGQIFFDINSVSPARKARTAALVEAGGADYVDMAVMGPVHPRGHATPTLLAGARAGALAPRLAELGFSTEAVGAKPGEATAIKMARSIFMKGFEAVVVQCTLAAQRAGCLDRVVGSLRDTYPQLDWDRLTRYQLERIRNHGVRRAAEMREVSATVDELGLDGRMTAAIAEIHEEIGRLGVANGEDFLSELDATIDALGGSGESARRRAAG